MRDKRAVFAILIFASVFVLFRYTPLGGVGTLMQRIFSPLTDGLYRSGATLANGIESIFGDKSTPTPVDETELLEIERLRNENDSLREQLGFVANNDLEIVGADVVGQNSSVLERTLKINAGSDHGIEEGSAVVSLGYLIGQIRTVSPRSSEVVLIIDPAYISTGVVSGTNVAGLIRAQVGGIITLDDMALTQQISESETVVTSSLESSIPAGLRVGTIVRIEDIEGSILKRARLNSPVDFNSIQSVFVVR